MGKSVRYFYDIVCPYAYLGSTQIGALCRAAGATLTWKPMLLGGVYRAIGSPDYPRMPASRAAYTPLDLSRWAAARGVELTFPSGHPRRSVEAMRLLAAAELAGDPARLEALTHALYRAYWVGGEDIADRAVLGRIADAHGLPIEAIDDQAVKDHLRATTDEAVREGAFGAPTMVVQNGDRRRMFFGQDRLLFVEEMLGLPAASPALGAGGGGGRVQFLFDYSSPYTYLAATQIERVAAERGATVEWRPILLGGLFKDIGNPVVPILEASEARRRYLGVDLGDWAAHWKVPFAWPTRFPMNTVTALRMTLALPPAEVPRLALALFRAYWAEDRDLNDKVELAAVARSVGLDGAALLARTGEPAIKQALIDHTADAVRRGVFGLPTCFVGEQMFFGQDRLHQVAAALS